MSSTLNRVRGLLGLALGAVLCSSTMVVALQPPRPGELREAAKAGELEARVDRAKRLGNDRVDPRLVWRTRGNLMRAAGATEEQIAKEIGNAPPPAWRGGLPASGTPKTFVLLVDFPEYVHGTGHTKTDIESKFFGDGDSSRAPYESLRNYYKRASYDKLTIQGTVFDWYRAQHSRTYYQNLGDGAGQEALMKEAILAADAAGHDFSQYDNDGDGRIDAFFIKWTGPDNGWANFWWAYQWEWHVDTGFRVDGKSLGSYVWSWVANPTTELYQAHVDIHETGHLLGLPDLYDYNGNLGPDGGVGGMDMMDYNWGDHNCFSKYMLEWITAPTVVGSGAVVKDLNPTGTSKDCVLIMPGATSSTMFSEFFMAQYRKRGAGNDPAVGNPDALPTDGLLVWHIDSRLDSGGNNFLYDNSYTTHKYVRLMEADGLEEIESNGSANAGDFYLAPKTFSTATNPNSRNYAGQTTGVTIDELGAPGATMSARFRVSNGPDLLITGTTMVSESCPATNGAIDPYETVTLNILLKNVGTTAANSVVATLLPTGGVTAPSAPQNYGTIQVNAVPVGKEFTFTAEGNCGEPITVSLQLQSGTTDLGTISVSMLLGAAVASVSENFDAVTAPAIPAGWTVETIPASATKWVTKATANDTPPNVAFAPDPAVITDNSLISPAIPIVSPGAKLKFRHHYEMETGYDGGVLEIKVGSGAFTDILAAGGTFESGGYTGSISTGWDNPLKGRQAWTGVKSSFFTTVVDLPASLAGKTVTFRWRLGTDSIIGKLGWYVDSIMLEDGFGCCDPLAIVVTENSVVVPEESTATFGVKLASEPAGDKVVTVSPVPGGDADLSVADGATLTFNASNWNVPQLVTLAAANDPDAIDGQASFVLQADGLHNATVVATEDDDNSYDFRVLPETVVVPENGTGTVQVKLGAAPDQPLTVNVTWESGDTDITVQSGATLTFDSTNWDTYQPVILAAAEDNDAADKPATFVIKGTGWPDKQFTAVEDDNDILALELSTTSLSVNEAGTATFQVRLTAAPDPRETVHVEPLKTGDPSITVLSGRDLNFSATNYTVWQTVTLIAADDPDAANGVATIKCSNLHMEAKTVTATEIDDDELEMVLPSSSVLVPEGYTGGIPIKLGAQPLTDVLVTLSISGDSDLSLLTTGPIRFTPENWNVLQTITVISQQDDDIVAGDATVLCTSPGMPDVTATATEADNDAVEIVPSATAVPVNEMSTALFTVRLAAQPLGPVTVGVAAVPGDSDIALQSATSLTFTPTGPSAWNVPQTVIVAAARDMDTLNGESKIRLSGTGLQTVDVRIREVDDGVEPPVWYVDNDGDGAGNAVISQIAWDQPAGYVSNPLDCDDANPDVNPAALELCDNTIDDNCDGRINEDCPLPVVDSDNDGVPDPADHCAGTPSGVAVDADGCPLPPPDADEDGIADDEDQCPGTPTGTQVDIHGCPLPPPDSDGDGVVDAQDQCANTPAGTQVGSTGCPLPAADADGDGVADDDDQCPNTSAGAQVDADGCTVGDDSRDPVPNDQNPPSNDGNDGTGGNNGQNSDTPSVTVPTCGASLAETFMGMLLFMALVQWRRHG